VGAQGLPADLQHEYFLLTPPGVESCLEAAGHCCSDGTKRAVYCAYHGYIPVGGSAIVYANDPYAGGLSCDPGEQLPSGSPSDVAIAGGLAHEHSESVTDPELNAWYDSKGQDGASYNQVINGDLYWYQQESNEGAGCQQRSAQPPTVKKLASKSGPAAGGTSVTITGTQFSASAAVSFGGVPAGEVSVSSATSLTAVSPAGVIGTVDVTVTTFNGTSAIIKKDHFKYKAK
jgi:hypothetical protein